MNYELLKIVCVRDYGNKIIMYCKGHVPKYPKAVKNLGLGKLKTSDTSKNKVKEVAIVFVMFAVGIRSQSN